MPKIAYENKNFQPATLRTIRKANAIVEEYLSQGYDLTLRQLYYQMVARDMIPNKQKAYNRLGRIVSDARMTGYLDWNAIVDRTRNLKKNQHWETPEEIVEAVSKSYRLDLWKNQPRRVEVWIEKDALVGVISGVCRQLDVSYFSCRGYSSMSEMWRAARRVLGYIRDDQKVLILHLSDHDPSGINMTEDIEKRMNQFVAGHLCQDLGKESMSWSEMRDYLEVKRIALTMEQIDEVNPPPNPAKTSDSRFEEYFLRYGSESWELDALDPSYLSSLIKSEVAEIRDEDQWEEDKDEQDAERELLKKISDNMEDIQKELD